MSDSRAGTIGLVALVVVETAFLAVIIALEQSRDRREDRDVPIRDEWALDENSGRFPVWDWSKLLDGDKVLRVKSDRVAETVSMLSAGGFVELDPDAVKVLADGEPAFDPDTDRAFLIRNLAVSSPDTPGVFYYPYLMPLVFFYPSSGVIEVNLGIDEGARLSKVPLIVLLPKSAKLREVGVFVVLGRPCRR